MSPKHRGSFLDATFGTLLAGGYVSAALWGMSVLQFYSYFTGRGASDRRFVQWIMIFLAVLNTFNVILTLHTPYYYLVTHFGDLLAFTKRIVWSLSTIQAYTEASNSIIRCMYAHRVWILSKGNIWPTANIVILSLVNMGLCLYVSATLSTTDSAALIFIGPQYKLFRRVVNGLFALSLAAEVSVTASMTYYLYRSKSAYPKTNTIIAVLMKYTLSTGLIVTINAILAQVLYYVFPLTNYAAMFYAFQSKLYICSYLALLNAREAFRKGSHVHMHTLEFNSSQSGAQSTREIDLPVKGKGKETQPGSESIVVIGEVA